MLSLKYIQENKKEIIKKLKIKNFDASPFINKIIETDNIRKSTQQLLDQGLNKIKVQLITGPIPCNSIKRLT